MNILSERSVFKISGEDSFDFLQSVVTADISPLKEERAVATCLLSAQGRVLFDFLLYPDFNNLEFSYLVDCHNSEKTELIKRLNMYKLRSKVVLSDSENLSVFICDEKKEGFFSDPRHSKLPFRVVREKETIDFDFLVDSDFYKKRLDLCVAEGPSEITRGEALPLDYWMDKTSHVSFNKGCFIGQEVTARVYHRNKIRRRLISINNQKIKLEPSKITDKSLRFINQIGEVVLLLAPIELINIEQLIDSSLKKNINPTFILLDGITDVRNFGAIIRTAVAANVAGIIISQSNSAPINSDVVKTSAGTLFNMPICKVNNLKDAIMHLKASDIEIISLTEKAKKSIYERKIDKPVAIILGSEEKGISNSLLNISDDKISIPISNKIDSLNVSVAFSVMVFEIVKQKGL